MTIREWIQSLPERLQGGATVKSVYGEPITAQGRTIVPVARVCYGFGGGAGHLPLQRGGDSPLEGGGGGGGVIASPVGVIEITAHQTRFIPADDRRRLLAVLLLGLGLGLGLGAILRRS